MKTESLDYSLMETEIAEALENTGSIVLATGAGGHVTARSMSPVNIGMDVYMQTDRRFMKTAQMLENPTVALCAGNMQIEGVAEFLGHPMDQQNTRFCELFSKKHRGSFERYSAMEEEVVFVVRPVTVTLWKYVDGRPCRDKMNVEHRTVVREYYE